MRWSVAVGTIRGISIRIHILFFVIPLDVFLTATGGLAGKLFQVLLLLLVFAFVLLHELGHSLVAQYYRLPVTEIMLWPLGGVANIAMKSIPPKQEFRIAIAGPLVNFILVLISSLILSVYPCEAVPETVSQPSLFNILFWTCCSNLIMGLFNLIPAFPMDGGRILRSCLAMVFSTHNATLLATSVGQLFAGLGLIVGFLNGNMMWCLLALFIFFAATAEKASLSGNNEVK